MELETNLTLCIANIPTRPKKQKLECPERGEALSIISPRIFEDNMNDWSDCSAKCTAEPSCQVFTWYSPPSSAKPKCITGADYTGIQTMPAADFVISGPKYCIRDELKCPSMNTSSEAINQKVIELNMETWVDCGYLCEKDPSCAAWTFYPAADKKRCLTMSGYKQIKYDPNAISGPRNCSTPASIEINIVYKENEISRTFCETHLSVINSHFSLAGSEPQIRLPGEEDDDIVDASERVWIKVNV